jgi:RimJ/RimL family protein N-acetyltransferase
MIHWRMLPHKMQDDIAGGIRRLIGTPPDFLLGQQFQAAHDAREVFVEIRTSVLFEELARRLSRGSIGGLLIRSERLYVLIIGCYPRLPMNPFTQPVTLTGRHATLEPLSPEHHDGLVEAVRDGELWKLWYTKVPSPKGMADEIERRLGLQQAGSMLPWTVRSRATGRIAGMTTYMNIDAEYRRVEIGSTWYAKSAQRTVLNTECKLMLLTHAFETLGCIAVEFRTAFFNHASRRAIERLGAKQDGILRNHAIHADGSPRDTVVYSIIAPEWPAVKRHLSFTLGE